jgi:MtrB/PioB family decaheme-associated outer membrane protein
MKRVMLICAALVTFPVLLAAQGSTDVTGSIGAGGRTVENDTNSSKLTEYRDLDDQPILPDLRLNVFNKTTGWFLDVRSTNPNLEDRRIQARAGRLGTWSLGVDWTGIPHNFSNKAQTPYVSTGTGQLEVPSNVPITFRRLATSGPDAPGVLASDLLTAAYQAATLRPTSLATDTGMGRVALAYEGLEGFRFGVTYDRRTKDGLKPGFGPIGDRPPRTLNIQLAEPVDQTTQDLTLSVEWAGEKYQAQASYVFSDFANAVDTLTWENVYTAPDTPGGTFATWDRSVSVVGRRALWPDNRSHNASLSLSAELPASSRLSATLAYGQLEQNQTLLPYSFNSNVLADPALPRATAEGKMKTKQLLVDYVVALASRLDLRAWARYAGLDNQTPEARWQYVTSDTSNLNGTVAYVNKRINLPYAQDRTTAGVEARYRPGAGKSSLALGYERDSVDRDHREADTDEDRLTATFHTRPASWIKLRLRYVYGQRDGDYDPFVTREGYWYTPSEARDLNNPQFTFDNHPDMVRYDVADRARNQGDVSLTLAGGDRLVVTASVRYRKDDFDSDVRPVQPLASTGVGQVTATSPGDQLGLLTTSTTRYALDLSYLPSDRASVNAFVSFDRGKSFQRGLEFDENHKMDPSAIASADLGPWTRASSQWTADTDDRTWTVGLGGDFRLSDRVRLNASYTLSLGDLALRYAGYGVTNAAGTPYAPNSQFAFSTPPVVKQDLHVVDVRLEFPLLRDVTATAGYSYERFRTDDWMQGTSFPWVEPVGSEFLLRDTSRSHQWGNRLFNLGSFLAPGYDAHVGWLAFTYRF